MKFDVSQRNFELDKACWHISKNILQEKNLLLLHLPPYSQELNPAELLWRELRRKYFHNKICNSLGEVEDTLITAFGAYHHSPDSIKQLANDYSFFNKIDGG